MPLIRVPVRNLAKAGLVTDIASYDLPTECYNVGVNVTFKDGAVHRGPLFRQGGNALTKTPRLVYSFDSKLGPRLIFVADDGRIYDRTATNEPEVDLSPVTGWVPGVSTSVPTITEVNNVVYVNRPDQEIKYRSKDGTGRFSNLSSYGGGNAYEQFDPLWRFKSVRAFQGYLIGMNVTRASESSPAMLLWSNVSYFDEPPVDWDTDLPASRSGRTTLSDCQGALVDLAPLKGTTALLYSTREVYRLDYTGDNEVFRADRLFDTPGLMGTNCIETYASEHYCFGQSDIYVSNGAEIKSICQGLVRKDIFNNIVQSESHRCFTFLSSNQAEILFCYVSTDPYCTFRHIAGVTNVGVNRAAAYNLVEGTWSYRCLPWATSAIMGIMPSGNLPTYETVGLETYETIGGTYASKGDDPKRLAIFAGSPCNIAGTDYPAKLRTYEPANIDYAVQTLDLPCIGPVILRKSRIDLDEARPAIDLQAVKRVEKVFLEATLEDDNYPIMVRVGVSETTTSSMTWSPPESFTSNEPTLYFEDQGRILGLEFRYDGYRHITISGFDLYVRPTGWR